MQNFYKTSLQNIDNIFPITIYFNNLFVQSFTSAKLY